MNKKSGFTLIELLVVIVILGIISAIAVPRIFNMIDRSKQVKTMSDMGTIGKANAKRLIEKGAYADSIADLKSEDYLEASLPNDAWGNAFVYVLASGSFTLTSLGSDGATGPNAPDPWTQADNAFDPEIIMVDSVFTQKPEF